jgi:hypothetical protein
VGQLGSPEKGGGLLHRYIILIYYGTTVCFESDGAKPARFIKILCQCIYLTPRPFSPSFLDASESHGYRARDMLPRSFKIKRRDTNESEFRQDDRIHTGMLRPRLRNPVFHPVFILSKTPVSLHCQRRTAMA